MKAENQIDVDYLGYDQVVGLCDTVLPFYHFTKFSEKCSLNSSIEEDSLMGTTPTDLPFSVTSVPASARAHARAPDRPEVVQFSALMRHLIFSLSGCEMREIPTIDRGVISSSNGST